MLNIKIELTRLTHEEAERGKVAACYFVDYHQTTETDRLARDILAPLAVAELMRKKGTPKQKSNAHKLGQIFANCSPEVGGALWFCGDREEAEALTLPDLYRVRAFGKVDPRGCFVLICEDNEEQERAYLVRFTY